MEEEAFFVGQEFPDVKAFRNAIKEAAIARHFELRIIKSDLIRYFAECAAEDCPWRIRAMKLPNALTFAIRSLEGKHTCGRNALNGHYQASIDWIVSFIEQRLRDYINYKPKDILHDLHQQYGITIPYKQAWRAKERGLAAIYGSSGEGYCLLPSYCEGIKKSNPGSIAEVFTIGPDHQFQRLFVSFYSSIYGFLNGCLPLIGLGGIHLRSKYLGTLLCATSFDAEGGVFPLAFGIVDEENDESWMWFLSELHKALEMNTQNMPQLTFISDTQKGIADAVRRKFPHSVHDICIRHLSESIGIEFKNPRLVHLLWKAAQATTTIGFKEKMAEVEEVSSDAAKWLQQFHPSCWAFAYFEGIHYGHFSSNMEEFSEWILDAREVPIIQVIDRIHGKLIMEFEERRKQSNSWFSLLAPYAENYILQAISRASTYQVLRSDQVEFEVLSADRSDIVNIGIRCCSCRDCQLYGLPCSHAVAALVSCQQDVYAFVDKCFTAASYRETYAGAINPIEAKPRWVKTEETAMNDDDDDDDDTRIFVRPPKIRRLPGRPATKRICLEDINPAKHTVRCSLCNQTGHYKTTCKQRL